MDPASPSSSRAPLWVLALVVATAAIQLATYLPRMPERMAVHFDGAGRPNGFMTPQQYVAFQAFILVIVIGGSLLPVLILHRVAPALVNVPNKDYWFAPERRQASLDRLSAMLLWMAPMTVAFLVGVDQLLFQANLPEGSFSSSALVLLGAALFVAIGTWTVRLLRAFPRPPEAQR